jgi:hypothetical protein
MMRPIRSALAFSGLVVVPAAEVRNGFVENIHTDGPMIDAHELDYTLGPVATQGVTIP